jgi:predicted small secreted protein
MRNARRRENRRSVVLLAAVATLATACGTTVAGAGGSTQSLSSLGPGAADNGLTAPGAGAGPGAAGGGLGGGTGGSGSGSLQSLGPGSTSGSLGGRTNGLWGPGVTATTISLGLGYCSDCQSGNAALGASDTGSGQDERYYFNAVIDDVNRHGGVLGRQLKPVYAEIKSTSSQPIDEQLQAACATWTQDHKVFALESQDAVGWTCAQKAGAIAIGGGTATGPLYQQYLHMVDPEGVRFERIGTLTVNGLAGQQYFSGWNLTTRRATLGKPKIGLVTWDDPNYKYAVTHGFAPALRARGLSAETVYVKVPESFSQLSDSSAAISSAVFRFQSHGIDHVIISDGHAGLFKGTGLTLLFLNNAESQHYYPRYGFNAYNSPGWVALPTDQEHGMLAVGWTDTKPADDDGWHSNRQRDRCFAIMRAHHVSVSDEISEGTAAQACDFVWLIKAAATTSGALTAGGFVASVTRLGTSFGTAWNYATRLAPDQRDGVNAVRNSHFDDGCRCMRFTSPPYTPT